MPELYTVYCSSCGCCGHGHKTLQAADACRRRHDLTSMERVFKTVRSGPWRSSTYHTAEVRIVRSRREIERFEAPFGPGYPVQA